MPNSSPQSASAYLFFNGNCEEALHFYESAMGAKVDAIMRYNECPDPMPEGMLEPGFESKVMHTSFRIGETTVMASDSCTSETKGFEGFTLSLNVTSVEQAEQVFSALSEGGSVGMPLGKTFWAERFGMLKDKFGVGWMVNFAPAAQ